MVRAFHFKISRILNLRKLFALLISYICYCLKKQPRCRRLLVLSQKQKAKNIIPDLLTYKILYSEREELINHTLKWFFANKYGWIHGTMSWSTLDSYITNCNELSQCAKCSAVCITNDMHQPFWLSMQLLPTAFHTLSVLLVQTWNICFLNGSLVVVYFKREQDWKASQSKRLSNFVDCLMTTWLLSGKC